MKMEAKVTAESTFGQVLICLRMSKLNFVVKETPYSAYVTIRKRFVKSYDGKPIEQEKVSPPDPVVVSDLKQKINDLEKQCSMLRYDVEEYEIKCKSLEKENINLEDQIEELFAKRKEDGKEIENVKDEKDELMILVKSLKKEIIKNSSVFEKKKDTFKKKIEEKDTNIMMLENSSKSKELELASLRKEFESVEPTVPESTVLNAYMCNDNEASTSAYNKFENEVDIEKHIEEHTQASHSETASIIELYNCDECDFVGQLKNALRDHMKLKHEAQCETCKEMFVGEKKVKNHMCRIFLINPTFGDFYTKNWYLKNDCIRLFSKNKQKEVAIIHSQHCIEEKHCPDLPLTITAMKTDWLDLAYNCNLTSENELNWEEFTDRLNE